MTDYAKQNEVIRELQDVGYDNEISDYVFIDKSAYLNAKGRKFSIEWQYFLDVAYGVEIAGSVKSSTQCRSSGEVRLIVIDGEASYWKALRSWFNRGNFGFFESDFKIKVEIGRINTYECSGSFFQQPIAQ